MRPLVILQSFPAPRSTTNPYIVMLAASLRRMQDIEMRTFSWRAALLTRYDVFHVHWPEILVDGGGPVKMAVRQLLFLFLLFRLRITRTPIVRTVHNLPPHHWASRRAGILLRFMDHQTTLRIRLNASTPIEPGCPYVTIVHGDYRDWFARYDVPPRQEGRITYVGLIRHYKSVDSLIRAFKHIDCMDGSLTLRIAGRPSSDAAAQELREAVASDPRVSLDLRYLDDAEIAAEVGLAELIVLPYRSMHNSGVALLALSLNRPVLVPDNDVNEALAHEVGPGWVHRFDGRLSGVDILTALASARQRPLERPNLSGRGWTDTGADHLNAYHHAIDIERGATRRRPRIALPTPPPTSMR